MKTSIKAIFVLLLIFISSQSSLLAQSRWDYGLSGGINLSQLNVEVVTGDPLAGDFGNRFSYNAGLFGEYAFNSRMFLHIGFNIDQRGFTYKESDQNNSVDLTVKAPYLEFPFLFRYSFLTKEKFALYGMAGPSFAFLIGGKIKGERTVNGTVGDINEKVTDTYNSSDIGIKIGLGSEFPFADDMGAVFFDIRYYYGFTDNIKQAGYYESSNLDANSQVLSFIVGVRGFIE